MQLDTQVTLTLQDMPFHEALQALCAAAGVTYSKGPEGKVYTIEPTLSITIGGRGSPSSEVSASGTPGPS